MKIGWYQYDMKWLDSEANINLIAEKFRSNSIDCDLLVFPEMFDTGFAMKPHELQNRNQSEVLSFMQKLSSQYSCAFVFSMVWKTDDYFTNRLFYVAGPEVEYYDKVHLFGLAGESEYYKSGKERKIITLKNGIRILPLVCYDLRFPEIARNTSDIDLLIYVASWPEARITQWDILLRARAVENQCHVLGVNRLGEDGNGYRYVGHSALYGFDGKHKVDEIEKAWEGENLIFSTLDFEKQNKYRNKLPFLKDIHYKLSI